MKKSGLKKSTKIVGLVCIIAILASMWCQFIAGWSFSGIITDEDTGEERAKDLNISLASYIWFPYEQESKAFENYLKDPTLNYSEEVVETEEFSEEELKELEAKLEEADEEPVVEEVATEETATEETATEETTTEETEVATEEEVEEESGSTFTYYATLVEIEEYHKDITDKSHYKTVLATTKNNKAMIARCEELANSMNTDYSKYINDLIVLPILLLIASIISIILIVLSMRKGSVRYIASICAFLIGIVNIIHLYTQPLFLLSQSKAFGTMRAIFVVTAVLGLFFLYKDIRSTFKSEVNE